MKNAPMSVRHMISIMIVTIPSVRAYAMVKTILCMRLNNREVKHLTDRGFVRKKPDEIWQLTEKGRGVFIRVPKM